MSKVIYGILIAIAAVYIFVVMGHNLTAALEAHPVENASLAASALPAAYDDFTETGTLTFYPSNPDPIPYLFYQDANGSTLSKALVLVNESASDYYAWTGARVKVTGHTEQEHVLVSSLVYISAP